jgi:hypothetical protein
MTEIIRHWHYVTAPYQFPIALLADQGVDISQCYYTTAIEIIETKTREWLKEHSLGEHRIVPSRRSEICVAFVDENDAFAFRMAFC